jgi:putative glutamine amidotransferase
MKKTPVIAMSVTDHVRDTTFKEWLWHYPHALLAYGALPLALPLTDHPDIIDGVLDKVDGVLLTGGCDIAPAYFGEAIAGTREVSPVRDAFEALLVPRVMERDLPLLGICRGIQAMNVFCGGSLVQDLPVPHANPQRVIITGGMLAEIYGTGHLSVTSYHHQAVKRLAEGFVVTARAEDGTIEAIERPASRFALGVQWHPEKEFDTDMPARKIFARFVDVCRTRG